MPIYLNPTHDGIRRAGVIDAALRFIPSFSLYCMGMLSYGGAFVPHGCAPCSGPLFSSTMLCMPVALCYISTVFLVSPLQAPAFHLLLTLCMPALSYGGVHSPTGKRVAVGFQPSSGQLSLTAGKCFPLDRPSFHLPLIPWPTCSPLPGQFR